MLPQALGGKGTPYIHPYLLLVGFKNYHVMQFWHKFCPSKIGTKFSLLKLRHLYFAKILTACYLCKLRLGPGLSFIEELIIVSEYFQQQSNIE